MKLHNSPLSPFGRKVMLVLHETELASRVEVVMQAVSPTNSTSPVHADNPLGKIPCLVLDEGFALYDSRVICDYLDTLHKGPRLIPTDGPARYLALRQQALADGITDAAVLIRYETFLRPEEKRWPEWIEGQLGKLRRGLDQLERESAGFGDAVHIGVLAAAATVGYVDFRLPDEDWRATRPNLAAWFARFSERPSMQATLPK